MNKKVFNKKKINPTDYINTLTGECLTSEIENITSVNTVNPNLTIISSKEYIVVDSQAMEYLKTIFNKSDIARIYEMADMVHGRYNILYDNKKVPHTHETLQKELDYSLNKFRDFLKRLYKSGVISYLLSHINNKDYKFIIVNPYIARKSKMFEKDCVNKFRVYLEEFNE